VAQRSSGGDDDGRPGETVVGQVVERLVGLVEGVGGGGDLDRHRGGEVQELLAVPAGVGGHAADGALEVEVLLVVERRDVAQMDAGDGERAAAVERSQGAGHERARRGYRVRYRRPRPRGSRVERCAWNLAAVRNPELKTH
jgi:hypothetical protein